MAREALTGTALEQAVADVRLIIADTDIINDKAFDDSDIERLLRMSGWVVNLAGAQALETLAVNLINEVGGVRGYLDVQLEPAQAAAQLRVIARDLRLRGASTGAPRLGTANLSTALGL